MGVAQGLSRLPEEAKAILRENLNMVIPSLSELSQRHYLNRFVRSRLLCSPGHGSADRVPVQAAGFELCGQDARQGRFWQAVCGCPGVDSGV